MEIMSSSRASRYGRAFLGAVRHQEGDASLETHVKNLRGFAAVLSASSELQKALNSRWVTAPERRSVIASLCDRLETGSFTRNLLFILSDRYLMRSLSIIVDSIDALSDEMRHVERVQITTSRQLAETQMQLLRTQIASQRGSTVRLIHTVDPSVLGGIRMQIGSKVWDDTVKQRLATLLATLTAA